jgi:hypothetical protein
VTETGTFWNQVEGWALEPPFSCLSLLDNALSTCPPPIGGSGVNTAVKAPRSGLGERLGRLRDDELVQLNRSLMVFLGLASGP